MNIDRSSAYNLIALANTVAILIGQGLSSEELGILSGFFSSIGDNLAILSSIDTEKENVD